MPVDTNQLVVVLSDGWDEVSAELALWERGPSGQWKRLHAGLPAVVGSAGMAWGLGIFPKNVFGSTLIEPQKREGDKRAPAGVFRLVSAFGRPQESSFSPHMPFVCVEEDTEAVDDPKSTHYNRIVNRTAVPECDWSTSEKMSQIGELYHLGLIVGHNWDQPVPGAGSCIFLHRWRSNRKGTLGCTAFSPGDLRMLASWLDSRKKPLLVQMPKCAIPRLGWNFIAEDAGVSKQGGVN
jgi:L,D-peptidoglycan transpeptidase YkuD (ErfK/YbiS/YcfS/YnhG family)